MKYVDHGMRILSVLLWAVVGIGAIAAYLNWHELAVRAGSVDAVITFKPVFAVAMWFLVAASVERIYRLLFGR